MKKFENICCGFFVIVMILFVGLSCKFFNKANSADDQIRPESSPVKIEKNTGTVPDTPIAKTEKADFTTTAEQLDKEFTKKGVTDKDLEKYANKNIAVTGSISMLVLEKKEKIQPWVTLYAPGVLHGVSCYFDDDNLEQMKRLKMDKTVTVQGFQNDFIVPEVSPRLDHCIVIKAD